MVEKKNNNLWYILGGVIIVVLVLWVVLANVGNNKVVCNHPYIQVGQSCCLDNNYNQVCDNEEPKAEPQTNYRNFEIKAYMSHDMSPNVRLSDLPSSPSKEYTNYPVWDSSDERYYNAGNLILYTNYDAEPVSCIVKEYYGSTFNDQFTVNIVVGYYVTGIGYEKANFPTSVRYDYECSGQESGKKYVGSYRVYPTTD